MPSTNIEVRRAAGSRAYYRLRQKLYDLKGGKCLDCGATDKLQVDHNQEGKKNRKGRFKYNYREYRRLLKHPEEWELRCALCHNRKTMRYIRSYLPWNKDDYVKGTPIHVSCPRSYSATVKRKVTHQAAH